MKNELKIKIEDTDRMIAQLALRGAVFSHDDVVVDTYTKQPSGHVLKISEKNSDAFVVELQSNGSGFDCVRKDTIDDVVSVKKDLLATHGLKKVLKKKMKYYILQDVQISINSIEGVGDFLVVCGNGVTKQFITDTLEIEDPTYIIVPFCEI